MTGPEHYAEAERLLRGGEIIEGWDFLPSPEQVAIAQVHATLAAAAATVDNRPAIWSGALR